ncbi:MAG: glycosyltransferase family 39 protein [Gammaproteobacteria bacterium]|jgi:hypothetical protein
MAALNTSPAIRARRNFLWVLLLSFAVRLVFAQWLPVTGDEAYFILWGAHPAGGYYDHPPMIGWWLAGLQLLGHAPWLMRLPALLVPVIIALGIVQMLGRHDAVRAWQAGSLFLLLPFDTVNLFITTDTPVILFVFLAGWAFYAALHRTRGGYAASGVALGLGMLSKYLLGVFALTLPVHSLLFARRMRVFAGVLAAAMIALALWGWNLWWNYRHCDVNLMFNLVNRLHHYLRPANLAVYALTLAYLFTPVLWWVLWRARFMLRGWRNTPEAYWLTALLLPLLIFAVLSVNDPISPFWLAPYLPFGILLLARLATPGEWRWALRFSIMVTLLQALTFAALLAVPLPWLERLSPGNYAAMVLGSRTQAVWSAVEPSAQGRLLATRGYTTASMLSYGTGRYFAVFGKGTRFGRQDDLLTDFRTWNGRNVLIVSTGFEKAGFYAPFFRTVRIHAVEVAGARFQVVEGDGFKYAAYRKRVLKNIEQRYYRLPSWLPVGDCMFKTRYASP